MNGQPNCARSIAVGPNNPMVHGEHPPGTAYTWAVGCDADANGDSAVWRYNSSSGWVQTGTLRGAQIVVDASGTPWLRSTGTGVFRGPLNGSGVPVWQSAALGVSNISGGGAFRHPDLIASGRVYSYSYGPNLTNPWLDRGAFPSGVTFVQIATGEPSWAIDSVNRVWVSWQ
jgi:hypothetical protein